MRGAITAFEPGGALLSERANALGAVIGGLQQGVEVHLPAQSLVERHRASPAHGLARKAQGQRRLAGELLNQFSCRCFELFWRNHLTEQLDRIGLRGVDLRSCQDHL